MCAPSCLSLAHVSLVMHRRPAPRDPFGIREAAEASADGATGAPSVNGGEPGPRPATSDEHGSLQSVTQAMQD